MKTAKELAEMMVAVPEKDLRAVLKEVDIGFLQIFDGLRNGGGPSSDNIQYGYMWGVIPDGNPNLE